MNSTKVCATLEKMYPGKVVVMYPEKKPTELLCEVESTQNHPNFSVAIAVIDKSKPHKHLIAEETYTVIRGELTLHVNEEVITLKRDESHTIAPGSVHWAEGDETWVEVLAKPGWTKEDHIIST